MLIINMIMIVIVLMVRIMISNDDDDVDDVRHKLPQSWHFRRIVFIKMSYFLLFSPSPSYQINSTLSLVSSWRSEYAPPHQALLPSLKHRQGMSAPSAPVNPPEKPTFHMSLRLLRVVSVVINKYYSLLVSSWFSPVDSLVLLMIIDLICLKKLFLSVLLHSPPPPPPEIW